MAASRATRLRRLVTSLVPALALILVLAAVGTPAIAPAASSPHDPGPDGLERFSDLAQATGYEVRTTALSPTLTDRYDPERTLVAVVGPSEAITSAEAAWLADWMDDGGRVLLADGTGTGSEAAGALDVPLRTRHVFDASPTLGDPTRVPATLSFDGDRSQLELRAPLVIATTPDAAFEPIVTTGNRSFVDLDGDRSLDEDDTRGPFTVGARTSDGRAVVLGSAEPFTNEALAWQGNEQAASRLLLSLLPEGGTVIVDTSHAGHGPAGASVTAARAAIGLAQQPSWGVGFALLAGLIGALAVLRDIQPRERWDQMGPEPGEVRRAPRQRLDAQRLRSDLAGVADARGGLVADRASQRRKRVDDALGELERATEGR